MRLAKPETSGSRLNKITGNINAIAINTSMKAIRNTLENVADAGLNGKINSNATTAIITAKERANKRAWLA